VTNYWREKYWPSQCWRDFGRPASRSGAGKTGIRYPEEGFALYADNAAILRKVGGRKWPTNSSITCCGPTWRRMSY